MMINCKHTHLVQEKHARAAEPVETDREEFLGAQDPIHLLLIEGRIGGGGRHGRIGGRGSTPAACRLSFLRNGDRLTGATDASAYLDCGLKLARHLMCTCVFTPIYRDVRSFFDQPAATPCLQEGREQGVVGNAKSYTTHQIH